jgi:hypothetical protein
MSLRKIEHKKDKKFREGDFSEYFGFPCQSSFHQILHNHPHLSSGAGTIGQSVAAVPSGPSWTPPPTKLIKKNRSKYRIAEIIISNILHVLNFGGLKSVLKRICGSLREDVTEDRRNFLIKTFSIKY